MSPKFCGPLKPFIFLIFSSSLIIGVITSSFPQYFDRAISKLVLAVLKDLIKLKFKKYPIICFETHLSKYKKMNDVLKKLFDKGYKIKYASSSFETGSLRLKSLGYKPVFKNIKTDDVSRDIYKDLNEKDAIDLICYKGGLRTVLMFPKNK